MKTAYVHFPVERRMAIVVGVGVVMEKEGEEEEEGKEEEGKEEEGVTSELLDR